MKKKPEISSETIKTFPVDPCGDFTFEENFEERTAIFHTLFTMKDDKLEVKGLAKLGWHLNTFFFN